MEIFGVGLPELLVVAIVALIVLGPERLPEAARTLGKAVADFRRAIEPARSAWSDVTREFTAVIDNPTNSAPAKSGNPWEVHPLAEGMTPEERERFFATGELPKWKLDALTQQHAPYPNGNVSPASGEMPGLDYPAPHEPVHYASGTSVNEPLEELDYPQPQHTAGSDGAE